jgi:hypothetical protein
LVLPEPNSAYQGLSLPPATRFPGPPRGIISYFGQQWYELQSNLVHFQPNVVRVALGLRATPNATLTTIPVLTK